METYYYVYKITNKVNGKLYIGVHKTNDLNDGYFGSGKYLKRAIKKYGIESFEKEIFALFDNPDDMFQMESSIVNEDFVGRPDTYNLKVGGEGGWDYVNSTLTPKERSRISNLSSRFSGKTHSEETKKVFSERRKGRPSPCGFTGKTHSDEARDKIGKANSNHQSGEKNSQFGTKWIKNPLTNEEKKISILDLESYIEIGWVLGRAKRC